MKTQGKMSEAQHVVIVSILSIILALFSMYINFIEQAYDFFREHSSLGVGEFVVNFVFLYLVGLLFVMYRRWQKAHSKQKELENIIESINPDVLLVVDQNNTIRMCNPSVKRLYGYEPEEVRNHPTDLLYTHSEFVPNPSDQLYRALQEEGFFMAIATGKRKDGTTLHLEVITGRLTNQNGAVVLLRDITMRKLVEEQHRFSEEKFRLIAENLDDLVAVLDIEGKRVYNSPSYGKIFEDVDALYNTDSFEEIHPDDRENIRHIFRETVQTGIGQRGEYRFQLKDGSIRFIESQGSIIRDQDGAVKNVIVVSRDVTDRKKAENQLLENYTNLQKTIQQTIQAMSVTVETRDPYTAGHQRRVADLACAIGREMGLSDFTLEGIRISGIIHDIGKLSVPAEVLSKPTRLTEIEFGFIKNHSQAGYDILKAIEFPWPIATIVLQHHERLDGSGYPKGLSGKQIILEARILAIADVIEAIASHRPYRPALGIDAALEEMENNKGIRYDEDAVRACIRLFRERGFTLD